MLDDASLGRGRLDPWYRRPGGRRVRELRGHRPLRQDDAGADAGGCAGARGRARARAGRDAAGGARARRVRAAGRGRAESFPQGRWKPAPGCGPRRRARARRRRPGGGRMTEPEQVLEGTEDHPHARMVLGAALASGSPSHAYLFHGPPGTGKRTAARALAAEMLAEGEADSDAARTRALHGTHPDLTWVRPTGAHVMRVSDVDGPVVAAAGRTPFESRRRVFVLERVDTMNDEVANRLLKTLEEPPSFVHLILLTDQLGRVLETVVSRCQLVRFDPLPAERIAATLEEEGVEPGRAGACGRLAF